MGTYKGNAGHLMQHWTLCELVIAAKRRHTPGLNFIDAHAMAPLARVREEANKRFDIVQARVQAGVTNPNLIYEYAWQHLEPNEGYPNSAAFVWKVWEGQVPMLLCETDKCTVTELKAWAQCRAVVKIAEGDWRKTFEKGLPSPSDVRLPDGSLTLVSFDPYMYNRSRRFDDPKKRKKGNLYPDDIERALDKMRMSRLKGGVLIQISTYSAQDNNPQEAVISSVNSMLAAKDFTLCAVVRLDGNMMSLVYARDVSWSAELANLPGRFTEWRKEIDKQLRSSRRQQGLRQR